jgi:hypothetical protein
MKHFAVIALIVATAACNNKAKETPPPTTGSSMAGSSMAGSAMAGSAGSAGSAMAGSDMGSAAMAGSGSAAMAGSAAGSDSFNWEAMSHEQRADYMKKTVMPEMKTVFQTFDAKMFAKFDCKTCHGKDPKATKFKMPNPELPKLDFAALQSGKLKPDVMKVAKWMGTDVEPKMAELLHMPKYDPKATPEEQAKQFGCLGCHVQKK